MGNSKSSQQRKWPGSQQQHPKRATSVTRRTDPSSSSQQPKLTQSTLSFGPKTDPPAKRFSAGLRVREQTKPQSFSSNDPPRASSSRAELKPLSARATPFPAPPRQHLQAGPSKRKTSSSHLDTQPQKKKLRSTSPSECKQQQQPSSEADYVEGMSQLSQLPFVNHPDRLRDFWVTHKAIFDLDETPAHPPLPRSPEPKPPSPTILDHRLDLSSPTSTSNQNKGPYHAVCQLDADDDATEEECDEPSPSGSRRSPRHPQSPLHKAQSGPDDSGVAFDANDRSVQLKFSPTRATQDYSSGPVVSASPAIGQTSRAHVIPVATCGICPQRVRVVWLITIRKWLRLPAPAMEPNVRLTATIHLFPSTTFSH